MTVQAKTMYVAKCDYPGCGVTSDDFDKGNNTLYASPEDLAEQFAAPYWEGTLSDDYGWLEIDGKHYCGDHVEWDEEGENRVPMQSPQAARQAGGDQ